MWPNRQFPADLVKFNEKICYVKLHFLCSVRLQIYSYSVTLNLDWGLNVFEIPLTAWKVSVFGVILVRIFPYSVQMRKNVDQNNSEYGHFSQSGELGIFEPLCLAKAWKKCFVLMRIPAKLKAKYFNSFMLEVTIK